MTNDDNETVEQVAKDLCKYLYCQDGIIYSLTGKEAVEYKDRFLAAHNREIAAKDAEIKKLRALVKEMAEIIDGPLCHQDCAKCPPDTKCASKRLRALVTKAREVVK